MAFALASSLSLARFLALALHALKAERSIEEDDDVADGRTLPPHLFFRKGALSSSVTGMSSLPISSLMPRPACPMQRLSSPLADEYPRGLKATPPLPLGYPARASSSSSDVVLTDAPGGSKRRTSQRPLRSKSSALGRGILPDSQFPVPTRDFVIEQRIRTRQIYGVGKPRASLDGKP